MRPFNSSDQLCHDGQNLDAGLQNFIAKLLDVGLDGISVDGIFRKCHAHVGTGGPTTI